MGAEELVRPSDIIRFIDGKMDNFTLPDEMNDFPGRVFSTRLWRFGDVEVNAVVQQENFHIFHIVNMSHILHIFHILHKTYSLYSPHIEYTLHNLYILHTSYYLYIL